MRELSYKQAARCETAKHPKCKCRCHGLLHGVWKERADATAENTTGVFGVEPDLDYFNSLPGDDPHHISTEEERKQKQREKRWRQLPLPLKAAI